MAGALSQAFVLSSLCSPVALCVWCTGVIDNDCKCTDTSGNRRSYTRNTDDDSEPDSWAPQALKATNHHRDSNTHYCDNRDLVRCNTHALADYHLRTPTDASTYGRRILKSERASSPRRQPTIILLKFSFSWMLLGSQSRPTSASDSHEDTRYDDLRAHLFIQRARQVDAGTTHARLHLPLSSA